MLVLELSIEHVHESVGYLFVCFNWPLVMFLFELWLYVSLRGFGAVIG